MVDPNTNGDEPRLVLTGGGSGARVVLAEADAPGSLHYLLEAEGFHVVGCAGDDEELGRVLRQDLRPDVIVLDADVVAASSLVARDLAPDAHLIAIWPDAVQAPPGGERINPRQVYEELGPAIRRHMDRRSVAVPVIALSAAEPAMASVGAGAAVVSGVGSAQDGLSSGAFTRAASRMSVLSVTLITAILLTMGVSFALGGFRSGPSIGPPRLVVPRSSDAGSVAGTADPFTSRVPSAIGNDPSGNEPSKNGANGPSDPHNASGGFTGVVTTGGGDGGHPSGGQTGDPGTGQGDPGTGQGDQGGGSGDQGGQGDQGGGGQGDQGGGGQGDQGGGQGGHGNGHGDHGNGDGQHGGDDQGDQDGDDQGEDDQGGGQSDQDGDDQGEDDQGDDQQGDQSSHGNPAPQGDGHVAHAGQQGQDEGN